MKQISRLVAMAALLVTVSSMNSLARTTRDVGEAWLGVYTEGMNRDLAKSLKLMPDQGVIIINVVEDSPAEEAGLQEDDVILRANGTELNRTTSLGDVIDKAAPGDKMTLDILRDSRKKEVVVTLGDGEEAGNRVYFGNVRRLPSSRHTPQVWTFRSGEPGAYLGVSLTDLTSQLGDYFGVKDGNGALISEVEKDSPAEKAGLKAGDVIVGIDKEKVADSRDVRDLIEDKKAGSSVAVEVVRDRRQIAVSVEVEKPKHSGSFGYGYGPDDHFSMPNLPDLSGLNFNGHFQGFNSLEYKQEMLDLRQQLLDLRRQLKNDDSFRDDMRKLKEELRDLENEVH